MSSPVRTRTRPPPTSAPEKIDTVERVGGTADEPTISENPAVGYRRPPKQHRFVKGKSGNLKGRPPKSRESLSDLILEELAREANVVAGDMSTKMSLARLISRQMVERAAKGDPRFIGLLFKLLPPPAVTKDAPPDSAAPGRESEVSAEAYTEVVEAYFASLNGDN